MYSKVTITNHETGEVEEFAVRIGPNGLRDWLMDREKLAATGHPDRPPDVDTPTLRAWLPHPGEEELPYFQRTGAPIDMLPEVALSLQADAVAVSWLMVSTEGGGYHVEVRLLDHGLPVDAYSRDYADGEEAALHAELEELVRTMPDGVVPRLSVLSDYLLAIAEYRLAEAELERGFINPLPEPRRIQ
jgi:hypothetical protein